MMAIGIYRRPQLLPFGNECQKVAGTFDAEQNLGMGGCPVYPGFLSRDGTMRDSNRKRRKPGAFATLVLSER